MKKFNAMYKPAIFIALNCLLCLFVLSACTKEVPKNMQTEKPNEQKQQMPNDNIHQNVNKDQQTQPKDQTQQNLQDSSFFKGDPKAQELSKDADDADAKYRQSNSDEDKKVCIDKQLAAANYLMFDANLSPKKKYRPALQRYRRVLELDPNNAEAQKNKKQIEEIYEQMGMPVPTS